MFFNRRIYFIKKEFQFRFILRFVLIATLWGAATVMLFFAHAERRLEDIRYSSHISIKTTAELLMPSALNAQLISLAVFAVILAYTIHALWKKLSIPLSSIKKDVSRMAAGDLVSAVTLREDQEFQDLASDIDSMRSEVRQKIVRIKEKHSELASAAAELSKSVYKNKPSLSHAASLKTAVDRMKEELHAFNY